MLKSFAISLLVPLNLGIFLFVLGFILGVFKRRVFSFILCASAVIWVLLWSLPVTSIITGTYLENQYQLQSIDQIPKADAIVVLGGNTANNRTNWFSPNSGEEKHSRIDTADELFFAGKANLVILSGGALEGNVSEAEGMAYRMKKMGVPQDAIILEIQSRTTYENATLSQEVMKKNHIDSVIVVTSALHMPRAMAVFKKLGITAYAVPNPPQIKIPQDNQNFNPFIPNSRALDASRSIIKEYLGILAYRLRGWI